MSTGLLLAGLLVWFAGRPAKTSFHGKSMMQWAEQYRTNGYMSQSPDALEARDAIRQIGTNAIPGLLKLIRYREPFYRKKLREILPKSWHERLRLVDRSADMRRIGAYGMGALGNVAAPAVPALIDLARNNPDEDGRYVAVFSIRTLGSGAKSAIPFLVECLTNSSWTIRDDAALGLGYLQLRPQLAVPALIDHLDVADGSTRTFELQDTVNSLARWGTNASGATTKLLALLNHVNAGVRAAATNALWRINPEAAKKASLARP